MILAKKLLAEKLLLFALANHGAPFFDAYTTRQFASSAPNSRELNPLMRPFFRSPTIYFLSQASRALIDFLLWKRKEKAILATLCISIASAHAASAVPNLGVKK